VIKVYYNDMVDLCYRKVSQQEVQGDLPMLKVEGRVVRQGVIPDLRTILEFARSVESRA